MGDTRKFYYDCNCVFTYAYRTHTLFFSITYVQYAYLFRKVTYGRSLILMTAGFRRFGCTN